MRRISLLALIVFAAVLFVSCESDNDQYDLDDIYRYVEPGPMVAVEGGSFIMGSDYSPGLDIFQGIVDEGFSDEHPEREVTLDPFLIDKYEVTNEQYRACVAAGKCADPWRSYSATRESYYLDFDFNQHPVVFVDYEMAHKYCKWAGKRLPTEAEWEMAARGNDERTYPWGNEQPVCGMANFSQLRVERAKDGDLVFEEACIGDTAPVKTFSAYKSPYAVLHMSGNVAEWVSDWYAEDYYSGVLGEESNTVNPHGPENGTFKVIRGGSFADNQLYIRAAYRGHAHPESFLWYVGFRCAKDAE